MSVQVIIRGVIYDSMTEAAEELGVTAQAISYARKSGKLETVGLGPTFNLRNTKRITIGGKEYASRTKAAEALGVFPAYITGYLKVLEKLDEHMAKT